MAVVVGLASCGGDKDVVLQPGTPDDVYRTVAALAVTPNRKVDLLFVIDDSPSMADKQANLSTHLPILLDALGSRPDGLPDMHIGVISTDLGTSASDTTIGPTLGALGSGGCSGRGKLGNLQTNGASVTSTYVSDREQGDGSRARNYTGDLATVLSQMVSVGAGGCGFEQPLAAMRAGLDDNPANAGFSRTDATLAVVILADEDDCSARSSALFGPDSSTLGLLNSFRCTRFGVTCASGGESPEDMNQLGEKRECMPNPSSTLIDDVAPFVTFLNSLKPDPDKLIVATLTGPASPVEVNAVPPPGGGLPSPALGAACTYTGPNGVETADPAVRLTAFANAFDRRVTETVCNPDLSPALESLGAHISSAAGSPCLTAALADLDPSTPGIQPDCLADDIVGRVETPLPMCGMTPGQPCWRVLADAATCPSGPRQRLDVVRASSPDPSTVTRLRCRL